MFINDIFKKKQLDEGGPFRSTEPKKPRKGSVADLAAKKRQEQERGRQPVEPRDHMVGVAKVLPKDVEEGSESSLKSATMAAWNAVVKKHPEWISNYGSNAVKRTTKEIVRRHWENMDQDNIDGILFHIEHELADLAESAEQGVAEGAPELLKAEMPLVRHIEKELAQHGYEKGTPEYDQMFKHSMAMYRKFGNVDAIKKGVAEGSMDPLSTGPDGKLTAKGEEQMRRYRQQKREQEKQKIIAKHSYTVQGQPYGVAPSRITKSRNEVDWKAANKELRKKGLDEQGVAEGFDDLDRFMKDKYGPQARGGSGIKTGTYGSPRRKRGRPTGAESLSGGSDISHAVDFDRPHSERSAGRKLPRFSDDYDAIKRSEVDEGSAQDKLYKRHQELRKKSGLPDLDYYKELKASYDLPDQDRHAKQKEIKQKYKVTNEDRERYIEELGRAGYEVITEKRMTCPECGGAAYADRMLAEKQDACYHKVKSRYKVWPSAYASGALVRCRKVGAKNWGTKSKK